MATKQEAKARKAAWQKALIEGRVVRSNNGNTLTAYMTAEKAQESVADQCREGFHAEIVQVPQS